MKIIIAPQAFKGFASASQVACIIERGVKKACPSAQILRVPIADGGNDTLEVILQAHQGQKYHTTTTDPLGNKITASWGSIHLKGLPTAIIELAQISGMALLSQDQLNPIVATTYGLGIVIKAALDKGYRQIFIGLGGSATHDVGTGLAQALGVKFLDTKGQPLPAGGGALTKLKTIDTSKIDPRIAQTKFIAGCDVTNTLTGSHGAALYAPQKGATPTMVRQLEKAVSNFQQVVKDHFEIDYTLLPYGGAAGGTAAGLNLFLNAELVSGAEWILDAIHLDEKLDHAHLLIVAEGRMDEQTSFQKAPLAAAQRAKMKKIPVIGLSGTVDKGFEKLNLLGIDAIIPVSFLPLSDMPPNPAILLEQAAQQAIRLFNLG